MSPSLRPPTLLLRTQPDTRLVALTQAGHESAFAALSERYRGELLAFVRRAVPEARADDVVQETFLRAYQALGKGTDVQNARAWLHRIARNAALDGVAAKGYDYDELTDALAATHDVAEEAERRRVVRAALTGLAHLPESQRRALLETALGSSRADIAADMGVSEGAVRQLAHRGRTALRHAAAAFVPFPLLARLLERSEAAVAAGARTGEMAAAAATTGGGSLLLGQGTAILAVGAIAGGAVLGGGATGGGSQPSAAGAAPPAAVAPAPQAPGPPASVAGAVADVVERSELRERRGRPAAGEGDERDGRGGEGDRERAEDQRELGKEAGEGRADDRDPAETAAEEPKTDDPEANDPEAEEPKADRDPAETETEEPKADEPADAEPDKADEPKADDPADDRLDGHVRVQPLLPAAPAPDPDDLDPPEVEPDE